MLAEGLKGLEPPFFKIDSVTHGPALLTSPCVHLLQNLKVTGPSVLQWEAGPRLSE